MRFGRRSMPESRFAPFGRFRRSHEFWLLIVILALCASLGVANAQFLTMQNLFDLLTSYAFVGILARTAGGANRRRHRHLLHRNRVGRTICHAFGGECVWRELDRRLCY